MLNANTEYRGMAARKGIKAAIAAWVMGAAFSASAFAEDTVKIAVIVPLAGAFASSGQDVLHGAQLAADEINAKGGIKSIGGRKIELIQGDAGQSPQTAVATARRVLNQNPVAAIGSWYSSLTIAATQVAEQKHIPWVTGSVADAIAARGFHYVYKTSSSSEASAQGLINAIEKVGLGKTRLALLTDNNSVNVDIKAFLKTKIKGEEIVSEQTWTPPMSDATPAVNAILRSNPNIIFLGATSTSDQALLIKQLAAQGNTAPIILGASSAANPIFKDAVGDKGMEGVMVVTGIAFPGKGSEEINARYVAATKEAFMDCEALTGYVNINAIYEALEKAGKADPEAVKQALDTLEIKDHPAFRMIPGGSDFKFNKAGVLETAQTATLQWQNGKPVVIWPASVATGKLKTKI